MGVTADENGRVIELDLLEVGLSGELPPELGNLSSLERINLAHNSLSGEIPPELGNLSNLFELVLSDNQLSREIPPELGNLSNLFKLVLSDNQLSGEIPSELGNLGRLSSLYLESNQLDGEIPPELGNLSNLFELVLSDNQLSGEIPPGLGNLGRLSSLYLEDNQLTGCVPYSLLDQLYLDTSNLGDLPFCTPGPAATATPYPTLSPGAMMDREALVALYNATGGGNWHRKQNWLTDRPLSTWEGVETDFEIGTGSEGRVVFLFLRDNNLSGEIPSELGSLANMEALDLFRNNLSGEIPPALSNLVNLSYLDLSRNQLSGDIPPELGNLSSLGLLYLHENNLSGDIPPELGNLSNLKDLRIDGSWAFSGCIPASLQAQAGHGTLRTCRTCPSAEAANHPQLPPPATGLDQSVQFLLTIAPAIPALSGKVELHGTHWQEHLTISLLALTALMGRRHTGLHAESKAGRFWTPPT